ncbi:DNA gyrase/topoisomerase IV subunit A family protein [Cryptosporidium meleagridis]|uniref:DNA topoisomerase 2 n=1 Tax=Cryptosporidium meleagridis TaxID=93969 RepID=A0A2P4YZP6_9CRYT|nr:DNA gyrase/topoisomerase IV subunit A family protein [Cryptosporidium meleagridis]
MILEESQLENNELISNGKITSRPKVVNKSKKTVEERYQKKTQIEHILLRPDTYIGSTEFHEQALWVWDDSNMKMVYKTINYVPGLYKIFDEILVNAADVKAREISTKNNHIFEKCTCIKVEINREKKEITVFNDGEGIPIEIHREHQVYVPELIFGHLLTSDNYDDNEDRVTGGRNGFGAKLTNIFSKEFKVECGDNNTGRIFKMTWYDNMSKKSEENIKENYSGKSYVKITFKPDLSRFGNMKDFDDDIISLLNKRVYDISGTSGVKVYLNGSLIPIKDFKSYTLLYLKSRINNTNVIENNNNGNNIEKKTSTIRTLRNTNKKNTSKNNSYDEEFENYNIENDDDYDNNFEEDMMEDDEWDDEPKSSKKKNSNSNSKKKKSGQNDNNGLSSSLLLSGGGSDTNSPLIIYESVPKWEIVISESDGGQFQHVSFVNSICTIKGGTHISYVLDPLINAILKKVQTKNKGGMDVKSNHVKNHIWIFIKCLIVNPSFDSQTKETLTTKVSKFGSVCTLSEKTINSVVKSSIVENVLMWAQLKQSMELKKKMKSNQKNTVTSRLLGIPKLEDANEAGGPHSKKCTLILTEGDSAKTSCLAGLSIVGRDYFGVFPLRGKLLNVREASFKQQISNVEIQNILKILGLCIGQKYDNGPVNLRYGSLMLMTDQDHDGSHIKGLIINLIHYYWPSLIHFRGFLKQFVTPIVKAKKGSNEISFFTLYEYEQWRKSNSSNLNGWRFKYYKGLGTSTDLEFKEYFTKIENHSIEFDWMDDQDDEAIDMAFSKKRTEDRKNWIESYKEGTYVDYSINNQCRNLRYFDFIHKELVLFSRYDTTRSIPNLLDGLKPGQRKVLFATFKKKLNNELKVAQLAGYVAEHSAYHHGESSLQSTIVNMAQNFVGSNNLNLLEPCGQFGSRKEGGKDASAARYIFTKLSKWTRYIFPEADDPLLTYLYDDGQQIEPLYYVPIIPMILVNGTDGIGTGWSSSVPNYNPKDIIMNLKRMLKGEMMVPMTPWYKSFKGKIFPIKQKSKKNSANSGGGNNNKKKKLINSFNNESNSSILVGSQVDAEDDNLQQIQKENNIGNGIIEETLELGANYETFGNWYKKNEETLVITELPVRRWTQDYKEWLESTLLPAPNADNDDIENSWIIDYRDNSSHESVHITVRMRPEKLKQAEMEGIEKIFRLKSTLSTSNMTLFDHNSRIVRYETELDILKEFIPIRLEMYEKRKNYLLSKLNYEKCLLEQKILFLKLVIQGVIGLSNKSKETLVSDLKKNNIKSIKQVQELTQWVGGSNLAQNSISGSGIGGNPSFTDSGDNSMDYINFEMNSFDYLESSQQDGILESNSYSRETNKGNELKLFDYLLSMPFWSLTKEKMELLEADLIKKTEEYEKLLKTSIEEIWNTELDELLKVIEEEETQDELIEAEHNSLIQKRRLSVDWNDSKKKRTGTSRKRKNETTKKQEGLRVKNPQKSNLKKITAKPTKKSRIDDSDEEDYIDGDNYSGEDDYYDDIGDDFYGSDNSKDSNDQIISNSEESENEEFNNLTSDLDDFSDDIIGGGNKGKRTQKTLANKSKTDNQGETKLSNLKKAKNNSSVKGSLKDKKQGLLKVSKSTGGSSFGRIVSGAADTATDITNINITSNNTSTKKENIENSSSKPLESVSLLQRLQQRTNLVNSLNQSLNSLSSSLTKVASTTGSSSLGGGPATKQTKITDLFKSKNSESVESIAARSGSKKKQNSQNSENEIISRPKRGKRKTIIESEEEEEEEEEEDDDDEIEDQESVSNISSDSLKESDFSEYSDF